MNLNDYLAGLYEAQYEYQSFMPTPIHPPWVIADAKLQTLLGQADRVLGELNAFSQRVPDIEFVIRTYVAKEATQSSKIEGTQTNIEDAFKQAADLSPEKREIGQRCKIISGRSILRLKVWSVCHCPID